MLRFQRGLDVDYVNDSARRRPLLAGPREYRAGVESERGQLLFPTRGPLFRSSPVADPIDHVPGWLVVLVIRPLVAIIVVGVAGAEIIDAVVIEIGNHHQRAAASRPTKAPCSFNRQYRRPERSEEHTSELQSLRHLVCRLLL